MCSADRNQGVEYANELAESCRQVRTYVTNLETEMKERSALIEMLEQSELYYDAQANEANTVSMVSTEQWACNIFTVVTVNFFL